MSHDSHSTLLGLGCCFAAVFEWLLLKNRYTGVVGDENGFKLGFLTRKKDSSLVSMHVFDAGSFSFHGKHVCSISARFQASKTFERAGLLWLARVRFDDESQAFNVLGAATNPAQALWQHFRGKCMRAIAQHAWCEACTKQRTYYMSARSLEATMTAWELSGSEAM